ncbi:enoyl-ACP reductase [Candidatus Cytomitobacter indipagum]|uniref:Enoyl-[acyl-carrier-protein] reductase [NADH] n=1 Tax=Candidatus Cytomitobacter indipagum TaxID=2601575 RepID=A0A5C0UGI6_9PROT|nr:enoyl-ACP reductase [Candidatus Cytomitobacter indipagum]QEK38144.1 enoyl-ACP reductase [Candidatus Cytomitobacter indipagum]
MDECKSNLLKGKRGVIMGIANDRSIASGIAEAFINHGAEIGISYHPALESRAMKIAESTGASFAHSCDAEKEGEIASFFNKVGQKWDNIDFLIHSIAFADKTYMKDKYSDITKDAFAQALDISCYSFTEAAKECAPLMKNGGSMITLSYYGAQKFIPHYNVMGVAKAALEASVMYLANDFGVDNIRVNCISAGPIRTLASSAIRDFPELLSWHRTHSPIKSNTTIEEVGGTATYLVSELSKGVTGEIIYVDSGYHTIGVRSPENKAPKQ